LARRTGFKATPARRRATGFRAILRYVDQSMLTTPG
jgi:hypothetical protein